MEAVISGGGMRQAVVGSKQYDDDVVRIDDGDVDDDDVVYSKAIVRRVKQAAAMRVGQAEARMTKRVAARGKANAVTER